MDTITAAIARASIDRAFPGHQLSPRECIELDSLLERNDIEGLAGKDRERAERLIERASVATYSGPDERY